jgi:hypothetical protein
MGFGFDIFPVDPEYRDENGELMWCSDDEDEFVDDEDEDEVLARFDDEDEDDEEEEEDADWYFDDQAPSRGVLPDREDDIPF